MVIGIIINVMKMLNFNCGRWKTLYMAHIIVCIIVWDYIAPSSIIMYIILFVWFKFVTMP